MRQQMMAREMKVLHRGSLRDLLRPMHVITVLAAMEAIHEDGRFLRGFTAENAVPGTPPQKSTPPSQPVLSTQAFRPRH